VDEIKPGDRRGTADTLDAVNVDPVARGRKRLVDEVDGFPHELGQHETGIANEKVMQRELSFDEGHGIFIGEIKIEDVRDSDLDEPGNISRQRPAALVDLRCYLSGFEGHVETRSVLFQNFLQPTSKMTREETPREEVRSL